MFSRGKVAINYSPDREMPGKDFFHHGDTEKDKRSSDYKTLFCYSQKSSFSRVIPTASLRAARS